jgi:4-diphosphocytidyl-2-C-methyl-D-erythritol kinase
VPEVRTLERELLQAGALGAMMSGSGTAVFGVFGSETEAWIATEKLQPPFVGVCEPVTRGVELL